MLTVKAVSVQNVSRNSWVGVNRGQHWQQSLGIRPLDHTETGSNGMKELDTKQGLTTVSTRDAEEKPRNSVHHNI
jgi:hypothetical protein